MLGECDRGLKINLLEQMATNESTTDHALRCKICKTLENGSSVGQPLVLTSEHEVASPPYCLCVLASGGAVSHVT